MKKKDLFFALMLLLVFAILFVSVKKGGKGKYVIVSIDGEVTGSYALTEREQTIAIGENNVLTIIDNEAYMSSARCPDQICVKKGRVSKDGEDIVCMPNRVIVKVEGGESGAE